MKSAESKQKWLIVGLGNPGKQYENTRHNVGFLMIDWFIEQIHKSPYFSVNNLQGPRKAHHSELWKADMDQGQIYFMKPLTFMNLSGDSVSSFVQFYHLPGDHLLVIHDEVDLPFGSCKLVFQRGHGGQNGVRDIHAKLNSSAYYRLRFGVGRPPSSNQSLADWVLSPWLPEEKIQLEFLFHRIGSGIGLWLKEGFMKAANFLNG